MFARQRINTIPLVSILIPAFDCYRLAFAKPGAEEISVDDDGSPGRALAGARQFELNEVRVVTQLNQRAAATRVPSAGDTANGDELKDDLEKYASVDELA